MTHSSRRPRVKRTRPSSPRAAGLVGGLVGGLALMAGTALALGHVQPTPTQPTPTQPTPTQPTPTQPTPTQPTTSVPPAALQGLEVVLPADATRRDVLRTMVVTPDRLGGLTGDGAAEAARALGSAPVLLLLWANESPAGLNDLSYLRRLDVLMPELVITAVHAEAGGEEASARAAPLGVPPAVDVGGGLAAWIDDPRRPLYVLIDRAGAIREVSGDRTEISTAVQAVLAESVESALNHRMARLDLLKRKARGPVAQGGPGGAGRAGGGAGANGSGDGSRPLPRVYGAAPWPAPNPAKQFTGPDFQGQTIPKPIEGDWLTGEPGFDLRERVLVIDFWATWCEPCRETKPILERLQAMYPDRLAVIRVTGRDAQGEQEWKVRAEVGREPQALHHVWSEWQQLRAAMIVKDIPHSVVVSTDGTVRWQGSALSGDFEEAVAAVLHADPHLRGR